jgi:hypothetical protein
MENFVLPLLLAVTVCGDRVDNGYGHAQLGKELSMLLGQMVIRRYQHGFRTILSNTSEQVGILKTPPESFRDGLSRSAPLL